MTTAEVHRAHVEELRSLASQIRQANAIGGRPNRQTSAMNDRLAAVEYAIGVLELRASGRHLKVVVNDGGESGDSL